MWWRNKWFIGFILVLIFSCKEKKIESLPLVEQINKPLSILEQYDKVRLISYNHHRRNYPNQKDIVIKDNNIVISNVEFVDDVILEKKYKTKIFNILETEYRNGSFADCYNPRHILLFYKGNELIDYYEFCAECGGSRQTDGLKTINSICAEQGDLLIEVFKELKLKNNGEETEDYQYF